MREPISFCFKGEKQFITVTIYGGTWTDDENKFKKSIDKAFLKPANDFLLGNCFC